MFQTYADIFAHRAAEYQEAMTRWPNARDAEFRSMVEPLGESAGALVCDMPSGGGYLARYLAPATRYLGVDPAEGFLAASQGLTVLKSAIVDVPLPDASVDHIVSLAGLHHEEDLPAVFAEMARLVRPGGRVIIADAAEGSAPARFLNGFVAAHNPLGHDGRFLDGGTANLLKAAGLAILSDEMTPVPWSFDHAEDAGAFGKSLFGLPALDPAAIVDALAREIGFDEEDGKLHLRWELRRIVGALDRTG